MNACQLVAPLVLAACISVNGAQEPKYSIREVGFVEVEARPYRLILMARDLTQPAVKKQEAALRTGIAASNITLVTQQVDAKSVAPDKTPLGDLATPRFWLVAPDDRVIPFQPSQPIADLVQSPLREKILHEMTTSLCAVVLLESKDGEANLMVHAKVAAALENVNRFRKHLPHAPNEDVKLLHLSVGDRPRERWTLWGLGEEVADPETPKVAVLFGRMRRAGPLFEGVEWADDELFARIAALGQACEDELDRKEYFGTPLPFQWPKEWSARLTDNLHFDPQDAEIKKAMTSLLARAPAVERTPRRLRPEDFEPTPPPIEILPPPEATAGVFNGRGVGAAFLGIGVLGWVTLGLSVFFLERRVQANESPA